MTLSETLGKIRHIVETLGQDDPDLNEIIQNETAIDGLLDKLVFKYSMESDFQAGVDAHLDTLMARMDASKKRQGGLKQVIAIIMDTLPDKTKRLPAGTVSLKAVAPKIEVLDEALLPDECFETIRKPVKAKIDAAFEAQGHLPGCVKTNGGQTVAIRRA